MRRRTGAITGIMLILAGCVNGGSAVPDSEQQVPEESVSESVTRGTIDPRVKDVLRGLSTFLAGHDQFRFHAEITYDEIELLDGMTAEAKIRYSGQTDFTVARPDKLHVSYGGDRERREFYIDGQEVTMLSPDENVYAKLKAPGSIDQALDILWEKAGTTPPLSDLAYSEPYTRMAPSIVSGSYIGLHDLEGVPCHHIFIEQETVDWQLWVDAGDKPLARKMVITYKELPQGPEFTANFEDWDFTPAPSTEVFRFKPPEGAIQVDTIASSLVSGTDSEE